MMRSLGSLGSALAFAALACSVASCGGFIDDTDNPSSATRPKITFVEEYGFCAVRCYSVIDLAPNGTGHVVVRERRNGQLLLDRSFVLSDADRDHVQALASAAATQEWDALYGCPDCVDQGRFELTVRAGSDTRTTVLDPTQHPEYFDALIAELRAVLARERG